MKVAVVLDSFKGSLSSRDAGDAVAAGILRADPHAEVTVLPLADGGEGTVDALVFGRRGRTVTARVHDPLGREIEASYGILDDNTAVIEMAAAAGLPLLHTEERDPMRTTTRGVGELILDALHRGCRKFIIGIGGSATNDGGVGMLSALGFAFLDAEGSQIPDGAQGLARLSHISVKGAETALSEAEFRVACDVTNPLCGPMGCSAIYAPQKGATEEQIALMDGYLARYAELTRATLPLADANYPGAGAAGGLGFAFLAYLGASLQSGVSLVLETLNAAQCFETADLVITGEGRLDGQSAMGKAPVGVARLAKQWNKPVIALGGGIREDAKALHDFGIDALFSILQAPISLEVAMQAAVARENLSRTAEEAIRLILATNKR